VASFAGDHAQATNPKGGAFIVPQQNTPSEQGSTDTLTHTTTAPVFPWQVILANDPVNLATIVVGILIRVLRCDLPTAERYMLLAHSEGRAVVFTGTLTEATGIASALMANQLWASISQEGGQS